MPPVIVVEESAAAYGQALAEVRAAGWRVVAGFAPPFGLASRELRSGAIASAADAADALLAVLGGAGLVAHGLASRDVLDRLLEDLRHVAPVDHRVDPGPAAPELDPEARAILVRLADGETLGAAAAALGLSRRTADRRLAEARRALGVDRTVEAIAHARRLGWLG
jgi:DNA-binding NarL/FixJ family response regulator